MKYLITLLAFCVLTAVASCGKATATTTEIQILTAPDGASCYVLFQNGQAVGIGTCK